MITSHAPQGFPAFFVIWVLMGLGVSTFFSLSRNAALKRRVWPYVSVATGLVFVGFAVTMGFPQQGLLLMVPFVALITLLNVRATKFCDACGKTVRDQNLFSPMKFCPKCGAQLPK